jgi:hypothetical protein
MNPSSKWTNAGTIEKAQLGLRIARELMKLADLTPAEHRREIARLELLELNEVIALAEKRVG